jgi:hypothetical protein
MDDTNISLTTPKLDITLTSILPAFLAIIFASSGIELSGFHLVFLYTISSFPHFSGSYDIAFSNPIFRRKNKFALYYFPLLIVSVCCVLYFSLGNLDLIIQGIIVFLIWHYVKQSYGVSIWSQITRSVNLSEVNKQILLMSYLFLGVSTIFLIHSSTTKMNFMGQYIELASIPDNFQLITIALSILSFLLFTVRAYTDNKCFKKIAYVTAPYISTSFWFLLIHVNPILVALLPLFHAIQYAPFILKANDSYGRSKLKIFTIFIVYCAAGYFMIHTLPRYASILIGGKLGGFLFSTVLITINIHHYALDSVLWKMRNKECRDLVGL